MSLANISTTRLPASSSGWRPSRLLELWKLRWRWLRTQYVSILPLPADPPSNTTRRPNCQLTCPPAGYPSRDSFPQELPTRPPYTAHLGNLSYDATTETVTEFLEGCDVTSVRIIEDRIEQRPKGFAYAEFQDVEGLKRALELDGENFQGRNIRIKIAEPCEYNSDQSSALPSN